MGDENIDYFRNGEYQKGRTDGFRDALDGLPTRNLDFQGTSYVLGYMDGREWAEKYYIDTDPDEDIS